MAPKKLPLAKSAVIMSCLNCGKTFPAWKSEVARGGGRYCCHKCGAQNPYGKKKPQYFKDLIRQKTLGRKCTWKKKVSDSMLRNGTERGERNGNWKGGFTRIRTRLYNTAQHKQWRQSVFIRDNFVCQSCGSVGGILHVHHIKLFSVLMQEAIINLPLLAPIDAALLYSPLWDVANGQTLCKKCHKSIGVHSKGGLNGN